MYPCAQCNVAWDLNRRYDLAERKYRELLAQGATCGGVHARLAYCLLQRGRSQEALSTAREGVRLDPHRDYCHWALSSVLMEQGSLREAEESALEAVRLAPHNAFNHAHLAQVYGRRQKWDAAFKAAEQGLAINPVHIDSARLRAYALAYLGRTPLAIKDMEAAMAADPGCAAGHAMLGWLYLTNREPGKAQETLTESLRLDPTDAWARAHLDRAKWDIHSARVAAQESASRHRRVSFWRLLPLVLAAWMLVRICFGTDAGW